MGEAAEYEIWRLHGIDISDDGHLERRYGSRRTPYLSPPDLENRRKNRAQRAAEKAAANAGACPVPKPRAPWDSPPVHVNCRSTVAQDATSNRSKYTMNTNEAITLIQLSQGARIISASYDTKDAAGAVYHFKDVLQLGLRTGDLIVVQNKDGFILVKVVSADVLPTDCGCSLDKLKHVVAKIDTDALDAVIATERQAVHKLAMSEVNDRLSTYRKQLGEGGFGEVERLLAPVKDTAPDWSPSRSADGRGAPFPYQSRADDLIDEGDIPAAPDLPPFAGR